MSDYLSAIEKPEADSEEVIDPAQLILTLRLQVEGYKNKLAGVVEQYQPLSEAVGRAIKGDWEVPRDDADRSCTELEGDEGAAADYHHREHSNGSGVSMCPNAQLR